MTADFEISDIVPAPPEVVYATWLDSTGHSRMTGSPAKASAAVGGFFSAWDGYLSGTNLALEPGRRMVQAWRSSDFQDSEPDSRLEVLLDAVPGGTRITIRHSNLPADGDGYEQGWREYYFTPMKVYFGG